MLVREVIEKSAVPQTVIAEDAGLSYAAIHAWRTGARAPTGESLLKLAAGLRVRSELLQELAAELERAADAEG